MNNNIEKTPASEANVPKQIIPQENSLANDYDIDSFLEIPLTQGKFAMVDKSDFDWLNQWKWQYHADNYAMRQVKIPKTRKNIIIAMHRLILGLTERTKLTDHINGNGLDNRRVNLRIVNYQQNMMNRRKQKGFTSEFKGVCFVPSRNEWKSQIKINRKFYHLGWFKSEVAGAMAYDIAAKDLFKEYANLNFVGGIHG